DERYPEPTSIARCIPTLVVSQEKEDVRAANCPRSLGGFPDRAAKRTPRDHPDHRGKGLDAPTVSRREACRDRFVNRGRLTVRGLHGRGTLLDGRDQFGEPFDLTTGIRLFTDRDERGAIGGRDVLVVTGDGKVYDGVQQFRLAVPGLVDGLH